MKKHGLAVLILTAALSLGAAGISAYAASGWTQEGNNWVYLDSQGNKVCNVWKKGADNLDRYLNSSGVMAVESWIDDTYYVDANGIMVSNKWLKLADTSNTETGYTWYYFLASGKRAEDAWKKIDNKYYFFDDDGKMQTGWVDDNTYYCKESGEMVTGWQKLELPDDVDEPEDKDKFKYEEDGRYWFYFGASGKKVCADSGEYKEHKISDITYVFDADGIMQTGWRQVDTDGDTDIEGYRYLDENGKAVKGWMSLEPPEDLAGNYEYDVEWFYFSSAGKPKVGPARADANTKDFTKINSLTFLFNENGTPVYGLRKVYVGSTGKYTACYFGGRPASCLQKGAIKVEEDDGVVSEFYFNTSGQGLTGLHNNHLYYMGKLQKAESGSKYQVFSVEINGSNRNYVVNTSGKIAKNTTVKDGDGVKYKTNSSGILTYINNDEADSDAVFESPTEPAWFTGSY